MKKSNNKVAYILIGIIAVIIVLFIFKDTILSNIDFTVRKNACLKAYTNRTIIKKGNADANGFLTNENLGVKLENVQTGKNTISFDVLLKYKDHEAIAKQDLKLFCGLKITDKNNKLHAFFSNGLMSEYIDENKSNIFNKIKPKPSINVYSYSYEKENNVKRVEDLVARDNQKFLALENTGDVFKVHFELKTKENLENLKAEDLNISLNELMLIKNTPDGEEKLFSYEKFTEWFF